MRWFERVDKALKDRGVSKASVGRELGLTGSAVTHKLLGNRPTNIDELKVMARLAGMTVAEAVGDDAVVIELRNEMDLIEYFRLLTPEQQEMVLGLIRGLALPKVEPANS